MSKFVENVNSQESIFKGLTKISVEDAIALGEFEIVGADVMHGKKDEYCVILVNCKDEVKFFFGGVMFTDIVKKWLTMFDNDTNAMNEALKVDKPIAKMWKETYKGHPFTKVEIIR